MVASGRASVFILRARSQTIIKVFLCFPFVMSKNSNATSEEFNVVAMQTWDHAIGMICVHEAGGKVCHITLFEKGFKLDVFPVHLHVCGISFKVLALNEIRVNE